MDPSLPQPFGPYVLLERIGRGAMSEVFKARAPQWGDKLVAIKRPKEEFIQNNKTIGLREILELYESEAQTLSQLDHPNLVAIYSSGNQDDFPFLVMEYVNGVNLSSLYNSLLIKGTPLPVAPACFIVKEVAAALFHLHSAIGKDGRPLKVLHTDLAARNILISRTGHVKLIDFSVGQTVFNLAKSGSNKLWCSLADISPEMAKGHLLDERSDVYQVGLVLYKLLSGKTPFGDKRKEELHRAIVEFDIRKRPLPKDMDKGLREIILKSLAPNPTDRYPSAQILERAVAKHLQQNHPAFGPQDLAKFVEILDSTPKKKWHGVLGKVLETIETPVRKPR